MSAGADITFVLGRAGAGKSAYLRELAARSASEKTPALFIVPEQFTFETERALCERIGAGLLDITVCSFTSLSERVLRETGERRQFLSKQGRRMMIRRCAEENEKRLTVFARVSERPGFSEECDAFFTQLKRFNVSPEQLGEAASALPETVPLGMKLKDLALLYGASEEHLRGKHMDAEDAFAALRERLPLSSAAGREVIIDGFDLVSEQIYDIIGELMSVSPRMTIALRADNSTKKRDAQVFAPEERILARLSALASERGKTVGTVMLPEGGGAPLRFISPMLAHLEHEAFAYPFKAYEGENDGSITLFAGTDARAEAENVADAVLEARRRGLRYRDMAIIATDMDKYMEPVGRALRKRGIAFFTDAKRPLAEYAASRLTVHALKACLKGFPANEVLEIAKTGLAGVGDGDGEIFENFVLMTGARGSRLLSPFGDAPEEAERARKALMTPLAALRNALSSSRDAAGKAAALYGYMCDVELRQRLVSVTDELKSEGRLELVEETAQVFNMLMELISQLYAIMGDAPMSLRRFASVYEEGLSAFEVGVIPTASDQLLFGSLGRSRAKDLEALFVVGAAEGMFPSSVSDDTMINDDELSRMSALGLTELPSTRMRTDKELSDVYGAVTKPRSSLYLSYALEGTETQPCALIDRIIALFPGVAVSTDIERGAPGSEETAFERMSEGLREMVETCAGDKTTALLYGAFERNGDASAKARLDFVKRALFDSVSPEPFGTTLAASLYGAPLRGSASRLERFYSCPFRHFASYGLKLMPRKEFRERRADEGEFCHAALSAYVRALMDSGKPFSEVSAEDTESMLDELLPPLIASHNRGVLMDTARGRALSARLVRKVKATAKAMTAQLAAGKYRPAGCEVGFGRGEMFPELMISLPGGGEYALSGRIDRLDGYDSLSGERFFRVVDYKTGSAKFDMEELEAGLKLQLPLYCMAIEAGERAERAAGMYYQPVNDPGAPAFSQDPEAEITKAFRLSGLTLKVEELVAASGGSEVIPVKNAAGLLESERFVSVGRKARSLAGEAAERIGAGVAEARPWRKKGGRTTCAVCDYRTVCRFDPLLRGCVYRAEPKRGREDGDDDGLDS